MGSIGKGGGRKLFRSSHTQKQDSRLQDSIIVGVVVIVVVAAVGGGVFTLKVSPTRGPMQMLKLVGCTRNIPFS